jgi:hypothetical protein
MKPPSLDWSKLRVFPLEERRSLSRAETLEPDLASPLPDCPEATRRQVEVAARRIRKARQGGAGVQLIYGAHLLRNGGGAVLRKLLRAGLVTHLATNGAGTIHDWEFAFLGRSTESVEQNVATGTFGTWDETGRNIHLALLAGALDGLGYGASLGRFIAEDGCTLPSAESLEASLRSEPSGPLAPARADLLQAIRLHHLPAGRITVEHPWKRVSILAEAWNCGVPLTVHPGIGYDIVACHPMFNGAVLGRAAQWDFQQFAGAVETLDDGVVLSIGSAIMGPQVFEKALSCVNNLRIGSGRGIVAGHEIFVVDLQDGGGWDWTQGEPPKTNPAYYLRFCKSFSRMGAPMHYVCCDNSVFLRHLWAALQAA